MFKEEEKSHDEMPPKAGIHKRPDAFINAIHDYIPNVGEARVEWISEYPDNQTKKLPYINGLLILNDPETTGRLPLPTATQFVPISCSIIDDSHIFEYGIPVVPKSQLIAPALIADKALAAVPPITQWLLVSQLEL